MKREPFPHMIDHGYWDDDLLDEVRAEFPLPTDDRWRRYSNDNEQKFEGPWQMWGPKTHELFGQISKLAPHLVQAFGVPNLSMETVGGGYHLIPPGGFLAMHADFNRSPVTGLFRRLNLLIFLNRDWPANEPGGELLLGREAEEVITPEHNTTVVFETSDTSWHGHPHPSPCWRASVAAYFFSPEAPPGYNGDHSTVWLS